MVNHFRSLLLNIDGGPPLREVFAEQVVDPGFHAVTLPSSLRTVRAALFGAAPDRWMLNWRLQQFLTLLHATPLVEYVTALDTRITYDAGNPPIASADLFEPTITAVANTGPISFTGTPLPPDAHGQMEQRLTIETVDSDSGTVTRISPPQSEAFSFTPTTRQPLLGTGLEFRIGQALAEQFWAISVVARPVRDLSELAAGAARLGEPVYLALFGANPVEPYRTFRNLWMDCPELPLRLSGLLCALAYRTEELRS